MSDLQVQTIGEPLSEKPEYPSIVILGGFASPSGIYTGFARALARHSCCPISIVDAETVDWLPSIAAVGWLILLNKLDRTVRKAYATNHKRVTLIGHSAGGVLARLYLGHLPFFGHRYDGKRWVEHVITLGSPHYNQQRWLHGGLMSRWTQKRYPDAYFAGEVRYTSVAGRAIQGQVNGSRREKLAYRSYRRLCRDGTQWGDGIVPVTSALLEGSDKIELERVSHFRGFGAPWYGDDEAIRRWWP